MIKSAITIAFCILFANSYQYELAIDQLKPDESVTLGEILTNFFIKYFSDEEIFMSIILPPSQKVDNHFLSDSFVELFDDPLLTKFAYNTLDKLDNSIRDHRRAFNLILTDDWNSLS